MTQNSNRQLNILGIETSCDETAAAVLRCQDDQLHITSNVISSQVELHAQWGGVVPNLAAREHLKNILPIIQEALHEAELSHKNIDLIAVTRGPGLIPALLMGTTTIKTLSNIWKKPLLGIHHIEGHIYANFANIQNSEQAIIPTPEIQFPILALVVSGGHTQLVLMKEHLHYEIIGETQDDAAGEAFDKVARILGLGYPGGPAVSKAASQYTQHASSEIQLPRPMLHSGDLNFSFSGLKTAVLYIVKKYRKQHALSETDLLPDAFIKEVAYEFEQAATEVLIKKTLKATKKFEPKQVLLAGGVSANTVLRAELKNSLEKEHPTIQFLLPQKGLSLDNAAMIASAAYWRWQHMNTDEQRSALDSWRTLQTKANLSLETEN